MINSIYNYYIKENIFSISKSTLENKIFICLSNKTVKIISYDFEKKAFNISEIIDYTFNDNYDYFYKCIQLSEGLYATSDKFISIWSFKDNIYNKIKEIYANEEVRDIL